MKLVTLMSIGLAPAILARPFIPPSGSDRALTSLRRGLGLLLPRKDYDCTRANCETDADCQSYGCGQCIQLVGLLQVFKYCSPNMNAKQQPAKSQPVQSPDQIADANKAAANGKDFQIKNLDHPHCDNPDVATTNKHFFQINCDPRNHG